MSELHDLTPVKLLKQRNNEPMIVSLRPTTLLSILVHPIQYKVVGTVRRGMNMGLLAIDTEGEFIRVNGWYVEHLVQRAVREAIHRCTDSKAHLAAVIRAHREARALAIAPTVVVRKRRRIVRSSEDESRQYEGMHLPRISQLLNNA